MYVWVAIDVNEQVMGLREKVALITDEIGSSNTALTLPFHISLRISFEVDDLLFDQVVDKISEYCLTLSSLEIEVQGIEKNRNIVWIKMVENKKLAKIHRDLVDMLLEAYGIQPHDFDRDFLYHTTLFVDNDISKVDEAFGQLQYEKVPDKLMADKVVIGCSKSGVPGEFYVIREHEI